ncbi:tRNA (guanine(26)-N(2))-dimethyltransferase [Tribolium castaneum]|uniref:tRNA (guanine(26)-N(2))-dimethyltransferase n=1 Tax=Tribolium castaneum TaxID=7070 RepID=UPI0030FE3ECA
MEQNEPNKPETQEITEGLAKIKTLGSVFYNPVQEFNRDLSIVVLNTFAKDYKGDFQTVWEAGHKYDDGISILEALSATGLRSIRYAKEVKGVKEIIANDISIKAVEDIERNICDNGVEDLVVASHDDATMLMYKNRKERRFDAIDLDPYGCPSIFLDSAVQTIKEGGLLLVTATDMAVLAGNSPETCYSKYGAISLRMKACHEMALRILLQCIEAHANRYGRYIAPLLSLSADFYVRVFVRVFTSPKKCKQTLSKLSMVHHCTGCGSYVLQPLGVIKTNEKTKQMKYGLPTRGFPNICEHCDHPFHVGGPVWNAPLHSPEFLAKLLTEIPENLATFKRIQGVLSVINEELVDAPLYYTLEQLSGTLHVETPSMGAIRSAILNAGFQVSYTHMNKTSIKTNAPSELLWDVMRAWESQHPVNKKRLVENSPATNILKKERKFEVSFEHHEGANPQSKKMGFLRFQQNPMPNWGPGTRATAMVGDNKLEKRKRNQGKRKREASTLQPGKPQSVLERRVGCIKPGAMATKGFKVTDSERKSRVGIAAKTLDDLKRKTVEKFKLELPPDEIFLQTQDGTLVENDEYFQTLHAQTLLIWVKNGEKAPTDAEILYKTIREVNDEYLSAGEKVQEFFTEKMKNKVFKLAEVLRGIDGDKAKFSLKCDHPEWFEGLDTNAKTKEDYMFRRAQDRIRTYFYKTREELLKEPTLPPNRLRSLVDELQNRLKLSKFNGHFFDRSDDKSLCDERGEFTCQGRWNKDMCLYSPQHRINPYESREGRIIFQTWNLDHVIERSRAVIPGIVKALKDAECTIVNDREASVDVKAIYNDLFTLHNLKFVHIVCHDKGRHSTKKAGPYLLY